MRLLPHLSSFFRLLGASSSKKSLFAVNNGFKRFNSPSSMRLTSHLLSSSSPRSCFNENRQPKRFLSSAAAEAVATKTSTPVDEIQIIDIPYHGQHYITEPVFQTMQDHTYPTLRMMNYDGELLPGCELPFSMEEGVNMYQHMLKLSVYDRILNDIQRQGRISFYMAHNGEESCAVGSAAALSADDLLVFQYREVGALLWRGFTIEDMLRQCLARNDDPGKGRQMPVHYTADKKVNTYTVSSCLGVKIPQAAGAGYAYKLQGKDACTVCYFGEGAASEGDFATGLNLAATMGSQTIFICRNNGWAISTPSREQYKGDGISPRGIAYGIDTIRVDGNDLPAVYAATKKAREICVSERRPIVIEFMTYRLSVHSTSDDDRYYRKEDEMKYWKKDGITPISRFRKFLINNTLWSLEKEEEYVKQIKKNAMDTLKKVEKEKQGALFEGLFNDVYDEPTWNIKSQRKEFLDHIKKNKMKYPELNNFIIDEQI